MSLKPELLRGMLYTMRRFQKRLGLPLFPGVYAYGFERPSAIQQRAIMPVIKGTFTVLHNMESDLLTHCRVGRHSTGTIWYWKDCHILYLRPTEAGPQCQGMPGSNSCAHPRAGPADSEGRCCHWGLHVYRLPCLYRRY